MYKRFYPKNALQQRKMMNVCFILLIVGAYLLSAEMVGFQGMMSMSAIPRSFVWLFTNFVPTNDSMHYLPNIITRMSETILMSVAATSTGAFLALAAAVLGSQVTGVNAVSKVLVRGFASFFRNIPVVVWAMLLLLSFKQNEFTGYLAITFTTFGYLTRSFIETIDETAASIIEVMIAAGASYSAIVFQGVLPMCRNQLFSWLLFLIENNIRDATLVGILTGTGIGFLFDFYYKKFQYDVVGMITFTIISVVILLELLSVRVRRAIR
ncbi:MULTISPECIES: ABC transporter permease subunit [unclassified Enterococcus]|uniref:ABC transporter permease subunit n=1 Tax=unclassified Enterococcus TaxID=2608891 RepID=UPI00197DE87A|nr:MULTISPECIES: ABC transporter permease subunit [unclassified Enterococcus]